MRDYIPVSRAQLRQRLLANAIRQASNFCRALPLYRLDMHYIELNVTREEQALMEQELVVVRNIDDKISELKAKQAVILRGISKRVKDFNAVKATKPRESLLTYPTDKQP